MRIFRGRALLVGLLASLSVGMQEAWACACCSDYGERTEVIRPLISHDLEKLSAVRFGPDAELAIDPRGPEDVGIATKSYKFKLQVVREGRRWVFAFRDEEGRSGSLVLALPRSVSILTVDPRREPRPAEGSSGPELYHEWKVTAPAVGTGIFTRATGHKIALVLQGNGNRCFEFSHWTLSVSGPELPTERHYTLAGKLQ